MTTQRSIIKRLLPGLSSGFDAFFHYLLQPLNRFVRWWISELLGLLPIGVQRVLGTEPNILVIDATPGKLDAVSWQGQRSQALGALKVVSVAADKPKLEPIIRYAARADEVILRLPYEKVLQRQVKLPIATEDNLREVLGFEMDRITPFQRDMVVYDYQVDKRDEVDGTVTVQLYVVPKQEVNVLMTRLSAIGVHPNAITMRPLSEQPVAPVVPSKPNLLEDGPDAQRRSPLRSLVYASALMMVVLAIVAVALPLWTQHQYIAELENAIQQVQADVQTAKSVSKQIDQVVSDVGFIVTRKENAPLVIERLNDLTRVLPDDTWLHRFELKENKVQLHGESNNASAIISLLENSNRFTETQFAAPLVKNAHTGTERFSISAILLGRTGS
ncbi:PilN domain-containing protein [Sedimenticola sp.]|uniref:PilN domain-containing protein n=1 Tax=Sedimenticola sp. TaxID=1940285 RepID=UPI00258771C5|nr:PilN domain-containing protein [Sedimenticola sp.]MCW8904246.1 PilN domain-containing protein [Sedimenticola sp.]